MSPDRPPPGADNLRVETIRMPAAVLGPENPLPPLVFGSEVHAGGSEYGQLKSVLPYLMQDDYSRNRAETAFRVAVLENDVLRATFLLGFGGRLWSLIHRPSGRELLFRNQVFQPANLGLRNAWFAGGVEWNIGATGHSPLTCAPLHAARVHLPGGGCALRLYEWERIREVVFAIDFWLPAGSPVLLTLVRIVNPNRREVPVYWWSNAAVPESDGLRVLAPSETAHQLSYGSALRPVPIPIHDETDATYPARAASANDHFFDTGGLTRPWIAALDAAGTGLVQVSTRRLFGRKLFCWGRGMAGQRWQEFLTGPGQRYIEVQAGLAHTQLERVPMPAEARWSWLEAYGQLEADPAVVHGPDWAGARAAVEAALDALLPARLDDLIADAERSVDQPPDAMLHTGSGWGALECRRRAASGETPLELPGTPFGDETLGSEQEPWLALLESGELPDGPPRSYVVGSTWRGLLETVTDSPQVWLHRGVAAWHAGDQDAAHFAWQRAGDSAWALRNRAVTGTDPAESANLLLTAHTREPLLRPLTLEAIRALLAAGRPADALALIDNQPTGADGRLRLLEIEAALAAEDPDRAGRAFAEGFTLADLREGEDSIDRLWYAYHEALAARASAQPLDQATREQIRRDHPVPPAYDFRLDPQTPTGSTSSGIPDSTE